MSRLIQTAKAYETITRLLDQEMRQRSGSTRELKDQRDAVDVAFYLLGWAQFEHLVAKEAVEVIDQEARTKTRDQHAWKFLKANAKRSTVRQKLDLIFHSDAATRANLDKDYTVRNEAAHNYSSLPREAKDVSAFLRKLEDLVDKF